MPSLDIISKLTASLLRRKLRVRKLVNPRRVHKKRRVLSVLTLSRRFFRPSAQRSASFRRKRVNATAHFCLTQHRSVRRVGGVGEVLAVAIAQLSAKAVVASIGAILGLSGLYWLFSEDQNDYGESTQPNADGIEAIREELRDLLYADSGLDDCVFREGTAAPAVLRLVFSQAATYSKYDKKGGTNGASLRFEPEVSYEHNAGLKPVMRLLDAVQRRHRWITLSDIWVLASYVAIEEMGGPRIEFRTGRKDFPSPSSSSGCPLSVCGLDSGRFPGFGQGATHLLDWWNRIDVSDREGVALLGAHSCGRLHARNCAVEGMWCDSASLSKQYFVQLKYTRYMYEGKGRQHYFDPTQPEKVLLPIEGCFFHSARLMKWAEFYAFAAEDVWLEDFAKAWLKITEAGCHLDEAFEQL